MKTIALALTIFTFMISPTISKGSGGDTVIIELSNKSKVIIYTQDKEELRNLEKYDFNKMIKDLNSALASKKIEKIELRDENGEYLKDTTIIIGDSNVKTKIKIGNMELLIDAEDWEEVEEEFEEDLPIRKYSYEEEKTDRTDNEFNIDVGLTNWLENGRFPDGGELYSVKPWASWYFGLNSVNRTWVTGPLFVEWGGGLSFFTWKMEDPEVVITKGPAEVEFIPTTLDIFPIKSKLSTSYINLSVVPLLDFAKGKKKVNNYERGSFTFKSYRRQGIRFGVGGYVGYRLGSQSKFVYKDGSKERDKEVNNFYMENLRYGLRAQLGFKGMDLFANYDLNNVFNAGRGPSNAGLNAISFGLIL